MKKLFASLLMIAVSQLAVAGDPQAGEAKTATCAACHGADGNSPAPAFPSLAGQHANYTLKQLQDMKKSLAEGGRPVPEMAGMLEPFSDQDLADIAAFYAGQTMQGKTTDAELLALGESVYRAGITRKEVASCAGCHAPDGRGNRGAGYPALAGQHAAYIEKQLKAFRLGADEPEARGARVNDGDSRTMRDVAGNMSDLEIRAVASFIAGLR